MIQPTDPWYGVCRISEAGFVQTLRSFGNAGMLAERNPAQYYQGILATKSPEGKSADPLLVLAILNHESSGGLEGVAVTTHSWGNTRLPCFGPSPVLKADGSPSLAGGASGVFPIYRDWLDGAKSTAARLVAPDWVYYGWGRYRIQDIWVWHDDPNTPADESEVVWAPVGDLNNPNDYLRSVLDFMNDHADLVVDAGRPTNVPAVHIGLAPGHADTHGDEWNGEEVKRTVPLCRAIAAEAQHRGFRVTLQDPIPFNGSYGDVASWFMQQHNADPFRFILQNHFEGTDASVRGCFGVYPDNDGRDDHDTDAKAMGIDLANRLHQLTGMPIRNDGSMSESSTNAGELAWFSRTVGMKAVAERLLFEFGASNSNMDDRAIVDAPSWLTLAPQAVCDMLEAKYGEQQSNEPPPPDNHPDAPVVRFDGTDLVYAGGFKSLWDELQLNAGFQLGYRVIGKPRSPEFWLVIDNVARRVQCGERATFIWNPDDADPYDVTTTFGEWDALAREEATKQGIYR